MIDPRTQKPVEIARGSRGGGRFHLLSERMDEVCAALDRHAVPYWRDPIAVSDSGKPYVSGITLSVKADVDRVQQLLDSML